MSGNLLTVCKVPNAVQSIKSSKDIKSLLKTIEIQTENESFALSSKKQGEFIDDIISTKPAKFIAVINGYGNAIGAKYLALQIMQNFIQGYNYDAYPIWLWPKPFEWDSWENRSLRVIDGLYSDTTPSRLDIFRHLLDKNFHQRNIVIVYDPDPFNMFVNVLHFRPSMVLNVSKLATGERQNNIRKVRQV